MSWVCTINTKVTLSLKGVFSGVKAFYGLLYCLSAIWVAMLNPLLAQESPTNIFAENTELTHEANTLGLLVMRSASHYYTKQAQSTGLYWQQQKMQISNDSWRLFGWDYPFLAPWAKEKPHSYFFVGNEVGDPLYHELRGPQYNSNRTPVYKAMVVTPEHWSLGGSVGFRQLDHFSVNHLSSRRQMLALQGENEKAPNTNMAQNAVNQSELDLKDFAWFSQNYPSYSFVSGGAWLASETFYQNHLGLDYQKGIMWLNGVQKETPLQGQSYRLQMQLGYLHWIHDRAEWQSIKYGNSSGRASWNTDRIFAQVKWDEQATWGSYRMGGDIFQVHTKDAFPWVWNEPEQTLYWVWSEHSVFINKPGIPGTWKMSGTNGFNGTNGIHTTQSDQPAQFMLQDTLQLQLDFEGLPVPLSVTAQVVASAGNTVDPFAPTYERVNDTLHFGLQSKGVWREYAFRLQNKVQSGLGEIGLYTAPWVSVNAHRLPEALWQEWTTVQNKNANPTITQHNGLVQGWKNGGYALRKIVAFETKAEYGLQGYTEWVQDTKTLGLDFKMPAYSAAMWYKLYLPGEMHIQSQLQHTGAYRFLHHRVAPAWEWNAEVRKLFSKYHLEFYASFLNVLSKDVMQHPMGEEDRFRVLTGVDWVY